MFMDSMTEKIGFENSRNQKLVGVLHRPMGVQGNTPVVIFAHGKGTGKDGRKATELAGRMAMRGISFFRFDFTGCGESDGILEDTMVTRLNDDLKAAYNTVAKQEGIDIDRIALVGSSLGGMVSLLALSDGLPVKTAVLISPATDYKENHQRIRAQDAMNNEFYIDIWKRDFYELARRIRLPCLVIHGELDDVCFLTGSQRLIKSLPEGSRLDVIRGEGHFYKKPENFERMIDLTVDWLKHSLYAP
jgi:pimeloyl-ACP methyl ester carboxylesterase